MKCLGCTTKLRITHTFDAGTGHRTSRAVCLECDRTYALVTIVVCETTQRNEGASAIAQRIKRKPPKLTL